MMYNHVHVCMPLKVCHKVRGIHFYMWLCPNVCPKARCIHLYMSACLMSYGQGYPLVHVGMP